jgi:hypothetical protein
MKATLLILFGATTVLAMAELRKVDGKIYEPVTNKPGKIAANAISGK